MKQVLVIVALMWGLTLHATDTAEPAAASLHSESSPPNVGIASWYGQQHQGKIMANGKLFDSRAFTTASRTLPLGAWIRVFNLRNGKSADVQVTDRGPNKRLRGRILDLSEAAAKKLGFQRDGLTVVAFVVLSELNNHEGTVDIPANPEPSSIDFGGHPTNRCLEKPRLHEGGLNRSEQNEGTSE